MDQDEAETLPPNTGALSFGRLTDYLGYHVRLAHLAMVRRLADSLAQFDVTQRQYTVLYLVQQNPGCSQVSLVSAMGSDRATMVAIVSKLEAQGLLARKKSSQDARRLELSLTAKGEAVMARCNAVVEEHERAHEHLFKGRELSEIMRLLQVIIAGP